MTSFAASYTASQLMKNVANKWGDRESNRLVVNKIVLPLDDSNV